jgi:alkanesulfonate monooxygenase SsuD/methylene tetrahydromethanopterin reductase-like flavin-dependent oxidoreductase (luciferase family)
MDDVRIGVALPTSNARWSTGADPGRLLDFAVQAEELGYGSLWAGDTLLSPVLEPLTTLAAVAAATSRVTLGTAAMLPAFRTPVQAAQAIASLDLLSGGRLVVTVGAGFPGRSEREYALSGTPWERRFARLDETVALWRMLWTADGPVSVHGNALRVDDAPPVVRPRRPGGPPVWLAGATPAALARTARSYDGWLPYPPDPADFAAGLATIERAAADAGRGPVTPALFATVLVTDDVPGGRVALDRFTRTTYGVPLDVAETIQLLVAGPPEHVRQRLEPYVRAGARHIVLRIAAVEISEQARQLSALAGVLG